MLDYNVALDLLQKYGFSSTEHPYLFWDEPNVGLCILVDDENYGKLERRKIFKDIYQYEEFLKKLAWMRDNASKYNVKMVLDSYETKEPKILFLRDNRPMLIGEMFNIEAYDERNVQKKMLDKKNRILYEIGDLLLVYDEIKIRQLNEMKQVIVFRNKIRTKYYELQKEVNYYNKVDVELNLTLLPETVVDTGFNEVNEVALKDRYNAAKVTPIEDSELISLLEDTWELLKILECNKNYYQACVDIKNLRNEYALVHEKLNLMYSLNENYDSSRIDLMSKFRKVNKDFENTKTYVYEDYINSKLNNIYKKYAAFDILDKDNLADFLRESMENSDYDELISRFVQNEVESSKIIKLPMDEVITDLCNKYASLSVPEQSILILSNSMYFRDLMQMINQISGYESLSKKEIINYLNKFKQINKIKVGLEKIKNRLLLPENLQFKQSIFSIIDMSSFDSIVYSLVTEMSKMKMISEKMLLNSDVNLISRGFENLNCETFIFLSNNFNELKRDYDYRRNILGSFVVKCGVPVLYSPYFLEFGDLDVKPKKNVAVEPFKLMVNNFFNLLVYKPDVLISSDDFYVTVADFVSNPVFKEDVAVVSKLKYAGKYLFSKSTILNSEAANRVKSIFNVTIENSIVNVTDNFSEYVNQPIVQNIVSGSLEDVNGMVIGNNQDVIGEEQIVQSSEDLNNNGGV